MAASWVTEIKWGVKRSGRKKLTHCMEEKAKETGRDWYKDDKPKEKEV